MRPAAAGITQFVRDVPVAPAAREAAAPAASGVVRP
jgi:hypothetical protein